MIPAKRPSGRAWQRLARFSAALLALHTALAFAGGPARDPGLRSSTGLPFAAQTVDHTDRLIIRYRDGGVGRGAPLLEASARTVREIAARRGVAPQRLRVMGTGAEVWTLERALPLADVRELGRQLVAADSNIVYAEPDRLMLPQFVPNDPSFASQWHYHEATAGINLPSAWDVVRQGATVAVIDTGYRPHADLAGNLRPGYDFVSNVFRANDSTGRDDDASDPGDNVGAGECISFGYNNGAQSSSWHGTHVAGTIGAVTNNNVGVAGVANSVPIVPIRVLGKCGGHESDIADAILWASGASVPGVPANANPARVINLSLGGPGACGSSYANAISVARSRGTLVVAAAGNNSVDVANFTPANCVGVLAVAAVNRSGGRASISNYGAGVGIAAPGVDVLSTLNTGLSAPVADGYAFYTGTSMAAPHVSGVAALMFQLRPSLTPDQVISLLRSSAKPFPAACSGCGSGIVNADAAVRAITDFTVTPNPAYAGDPVELSVGLFGSSGYVAYYDGAALLGNQVLWNHAPLSRRFNVTGTHVLTANYSGSNGIPPRSYAPVNLQVNPTPLPMTTTTLSGDESVRTWEEGYVTVTVSGSNPAGTVDFYNEGIHVLTVPLTNPSITVSFSQLRIAERCGSNGCANSVVARYSGDGNNFRSISDPRRLEKWGD